MPIAGPPLDRPVNLAEILKRGLDTKPDADALVSRRRRWTWRMLDSVSTRLTGSYLDLGLAPGDRIASSCYGWLPGRERSWRAECSG